LLAEDAKAVDTYRDVIQETERCVTVIAAAPLFLSTHARKSENTFFCFLLDYGLLKNLSETQTTER
jgi:hypothetical protein